MIGERFTMLVCIVVLVGCSNPAHLNQSDITGHVEECDFYIRNVCVENKVKLPKSDFEILLKHAEKRKDESFTVYRITAKSEDWMIVYAGSFAIDSGVVQEISFKRGRDGGIRFINSSIKFYE